MAEVTIDTPGAPGTLVYHGSVFVGETPLSIMLPAGSLAYIALENEDGDVARAVVMAPDAPGAARGYSFALGPPVPRDGRAAAARGRYYWSWAAFWGAMSAAWLASGVNEGYASVAHLGRGGFFAGAQRASIINTGALVLLVPAAGYTIFELARYLRTANETAVPAARSDD
jgi:hypothetical protein